MGNLFILHTLHHITLLRTHYIYLYIPFHHQSPKRKRCNMDSFFLYYCLLSPDLPHQDTVSPHFFLRDGMHVGELGCVSFRFTIMVPASMALPLKKVVMHSLALDVFFSFFFIRGWKGNLRGLVEGGLEERRTKPLPSHAKRPSLK